MKPIPFPRVLKILLDGMIRPWAVTHRWITKPQTVMWGPLPVTLPVEAVIPKPRLETNHAWLQTQLDCLPLIARLAISGRIKLYTTIEIDFESLGRPGVVGKRTEYDVFRNVKIEKVPPAIVRTIRLMGKEGDGKQEKREFLDGIRSKRFVELKAALGPRHSADIFHLWSAEKAGLDCFLTADRKFINSITNAKRSKALRIKVDVLSPAEVCEVYGVCQ